MKGCERFGGLKLIICGLEYKVHSYLKQSINFKDFDVERLSGLILDHGPK